MNSHSENYVNYESEFSQAFHQPVKTTKVMLLLVVSTDLDNRGTLATFSKLLQLFLGGVSRRLSYELKNHFTHVL